MNHVAFAQSFTLVVNKQTNQAMCYENLNINMYLN